jgi:hypothetical protein
MKKVAVCLHGELRDWNTCSKIFSLWNFANPNIHFDFFLATWGDKYTLGLDKYLPLKQISLHSVGDMYGEMNNSLKYYYETQSKKVTTSTKEYQHYYTYLLSKAVKLTKLSTSKYDAAITIRPDIFVFKSFFDFLIKKFNNNLPDEHNNSIPFGDNNIYSSSGTVYSQDSLFCGADTVFVGSLKGITEFSKMFEDIFVKQKHPPLHLHKLQAEYLNHKRIYNSADSSITGKINRKVQKKRNNHPSTAALEELYVTYGKDLYRKNLKEEITAILIKHTKNEKSLKKYL